MAAVGVAPEQNNNIPIDEAAAAEQNNALRFEDLTIDDDLPLLERVVRYCRSGIALQRLVHVKMLAETAETVGMNATVSTLVPLLHPLVFDPESIIRQHLASQLLPFSIVCMARSESSVETILASPQTTPRVFVEAGYKVVTSAIVSHLHALLMDVDMDVRRAASESLAGLAPQLQPNDVGTVIVPIPVALSQEHHPPSNTHTQQYPESFPEELRITACHLLAELAGAAETKGSVPRSTVLRDIWPAVRILCGDSSFKVRRSAAQALPRVLGGASSLQLAHDSILPTFTKLSQDDMYRVRKSTGECLVDMSRSLLLLDKNNDTTTDDIDDEEEVDVDVLKQLRRDVLIPTALALLNDPNKLVRHGMMQFLGPFLASFYPLEEGPLAENLPTPSEEGIGAQFFPHASSMVSRLNASGNTMTSSPTPAALEIPQKELTPEEVLQQTLPSFLVAHRVASETLHAVMKHCRNNPADPEDVQIIMTKVLPFFCGLAEIDTGDDNIDAEMRVYCAYSYPAIVLLLGMDGWKQGPLKQCFQSLVSSDNTPLPVKRCLASSLHTVAHVLGPDLFQHDLLPVFLKYFVTDTDDSVRLNVLQHFPQLLELQPPERRGELLQLWKDLCEGQDLLGARKKRSATNPMLLNWRQRDALSQSIPSLLRWVSPTQVHKHVWPVLQALLQDPVSQVQTNAEWSVPLVLRSVASDLVMNSGSEAKKWSAEVCREMISWFKESVVGNNVNSSFRQRQWFCRICACLGVCLRFGELPGPTSPYVAYGSMTASERKHLRRLLVYDMLPHALEFRDDKVTNVRLTLRKTLQVMPPKDVQSLASVGEVLNQLETEVETWESYEAPPPPPPPQQQQREHGLATV